MFDTASFSLEPGPLKAHVTIPARSGTNLKLLRAFDSVARHLSFTRAAAELGRTESTISVQVRELERQLDLRLLDRTTRRVALTEPGEALAAALQNGLQVIDDGLAAARRAAWRKQNRIVLGCVPSLSASRLPAILASYRQQDKGMRIDVEELSSPEICLALRDGWLDFGVGPCSEPPPDDIGFLPVVEDPLVVLLPPDLACVWTDSITLAALAGVALTKLSGSLLLLKTLDEAASARGLKLQWHAEVSQVQTAIAMARAGVGAAIVPRLALPDRLEAGLNMARIVEPVVSRRVGILTRHGCQLDPKAARLLRHVRTALGRALGGV